MHYVRRSETATRAPAGLLPVLLTLLTLGGCGAGGRFAPVDEVGIGAGRGAPVPAPAAAVDSPGPEPGGGAGVQVGTLPDRGGFAARPLAEGGGLPPATLSAPATGTAAPAAVPVPDSTPTPSTLSPAVVALVNDANQRAQAGQHDQAAASIERALKVEPGNAWLWHRLARARLAQGRPAEAESLAGRSNSLSAGDARLQSGNWRVIEQARRQRGDKAGADEAARRAGALATG